jgi:S-DNA-T family DNA segregation ATPase FtsK/SpoIIIE
VLGEFVTNARDSGAVLVAAATTDDLLLNRYRGWLAAARRGRTGLLLNPASHIEGEVFDLRLPRSTSGGWPQGRALLAVRGTCARVQVPAP